ncbi:MAG: glycoside hydrolase N-terminal domain-containing protein [Clostridia bacterium]|nr:glycoside hydrolase N-terminal domain-containing protein [Clostridia bacterium]
MEKKLINSYPASNWFDSTPVGNGRIGASVYGCVYDERILINHEALFNYARTMEIPDVSDSLAVVRHLMDEKKYAEAETYYTKALRGAGYNAAKGKFYPAFDIRMIFGTLGAPYEYKRELDMENGICTVSYKENGEAATRTVFASHTDKYVFVNIKKPSPFNMIFALERHDLSDWVDYRNCDKFESFSREGYVYSHCETEGKLNYSGIIKVLYTDGQMTHIEKAKKRKIDMEGALVLDNSIKIEGATEVTLLLNIENKAKSFDKMRKEVDKFTLSFDEAIARHTRKFRSLFNGVRLNLCSDLKNKSNEALLLEGYEGNIGNMLIEKMADYGRYLLISSSMNCSCPANLQGVWNGAYSPAWACTYFNNENIQMAYWQAYAGGLAKAVLPLFNLYDKFKDDYRENAMRLFGCRGILLPLFMDNSNGRKDNLQPHVLYWTGSSAWISAIYYDYYLYTGDEKFLMERAYPFMKESAQFYEDFLVYDENGKLKSYPSDSPENRPLGDYEGSGEISCSINATMDFALVKELLTNLISVCDKLGIDREKAEKWRRMLSGIPEYEINDDGAIKEWMHPDFKDNYQHRHQSHIYGLFPGYEINEQDNKTIFDAMKVAVEKRLCIGLKDQSGWSLAHMANIYARLGEGKRAKECLDLLLRFCTGQNLYTYHNDWRNMGVTLKYIHGGHAPFQIDANMGFTAAVYEMLMYSDLTKIKLLPAIPESWSKGSVSGLNVRGGLKVSIKWSISSVTATITADRDKTINVGSPVNYCLKNPEMYEKSCYGNDFICLNLKKGDKILLEYTK